MNTRKLAIATGILAIAFGLALIGLKQLGRSTVAAQSNQLSTIATVEGQSISAKLYNVYLKNGIDSLVLDERTPEGRTKIERLKEGIVSDLIDRALIEAECRTQKLTASDATFTAAYEKAVGEIGGEHAYRTYLSENGLTDKEFKQTTRQNVYGELLRRELDKEVLVDTTEIEDFYNKEATNPAFKTLFNEPERVHARHILVAARASQIASDIQAKEKLPKSDLEKRITQEIATRRRLAEKLLARVRRGADFDRLAKELSDDPATRDRGGDLGSFTRNTHTTTFDDAAFRLKGGETSGIVETEYGFHIIKVTEHSPAHLLTLAESRSAIREHLLARKQATHLKAWLEARRREADIQINPAYRFGRLQAAGDALVRRRNTSER